MGQQLKPLWLVNEEQHDAMDAVAADVLSEYSRSFQISGEQMRQVRRDQAVGRRRLAVLRQRQERAIFQAFTPTLLDYIQAKLAVLRLAR
jgi:hypothetical protein